LRGESRRQFKDLPGAPAKGVDSYRKFLKEDEVDQGRNFAVYARAAFVVHVLCINQVEESVDGKRCLSQLFAMNA